MAKFTHLHVHSHYSLLDGLGTVPRLLKRAGELEMDSLALTDHGVLYGAVEFSKKARDAGIKPIIGCELYVAPRAMTDKVAGIDKTPFHLVVLCQNKTGYHNLLKLVSAAHLEGYYYKPRVDKSLLKKYSEGLICLTACLQSEVAKPAGNDDPEMAEKALLEYRGIFGSERLFVELQHHPELASQGISNGHLIKIAKRHNVPLIATNDVHYLEYSDAEAQDALLCIQTGKLMSDTDRMTMREHGTFVDISMTTADQMTDYFSQTPEAVTNTERVAHLCRFEMELGRFIFPAFPVPEKLSPHQYLEHLCIEGMWSKLAKKEIGTASKPPSDIDPAYSTRMNYELSVIEKTGFSSYMLMVADYCREAKKRGIFTNTRGSAAGSLVAYLVDITDIDPLPYNLLFERFLNPERISWPDVDLDIADIRRGELIDYVITKYGGDKVAQIITFGTIAAKNSIRDVGRVLGMAYADVDEVSKLIPFGKTLSESLELVPELAARHDAEPAIKRLLDLAKHLEGVARHASVHAAGVVIADKPLTEYVPIQHIKDDTGLVTQYSMYDLETLGLVKMDFLGLANLTIIEKSLEIIRVTRGITIRLSEIPLDDKATFQLLSRGESSGVFQLESDGMKRYLKELRPTEIGDIIAMVALYRPGPMELIPDYIAGKHGTKTVTYLHPKLEPILQETYGIAVYQEQIIQIARDLCGFSYGEADVLRKAIGKKIKSLLLEQRKKWVEKGIESGIGKALAEKLFDFVEPFARYGFNKAHATSYGLIAYQTAYLKTHYPSQFMAAWLTSEQARDIDKVSFALQECDRMGIEVQPPDVNESFASFGVVAREDKQNEPIRFGLGAIKNVGHGVAEVIVHDRKEHGQYTSLDNFLHRQDQKILNRKTMESLIQAGAFDRFGERNQLLVNIDAILKYALGMKSFNSAQIGLFGHEETGSFTELKLHEADTATREQRMLWEKELLGIYLSEHPLEPFRAAVGTISTPIRSITAEQIGQSVRVLGIVTLAKHIITKSNQAMCFVKIEDTGGTVEIVVFPSLLTETTSAWAKDRVIVVDGTVNDKDGSIKILADAVYDITDNQSIDQVLLPTLKPSRSPRKTTGQVDRVAEAKAFEQQLFVRVPASADKAVLFELKRIMSEYPGDTKMKLEIRQDNTVQVMNVAGGIDATPPVLHMLKKLFGSENCGLKTIPVAEAA